jgi:hypothetical protein
VLLRMNGLMAGWYDFMVFEASLLSNTLPEHYLNLCPFAGPPALPGGREVK